MRKARDLPEDVALVLEDPGPNAARLGIGHLAPGYGMWKVGDASVVSVKDFVERILALHDASPAESRKIRIVYVYRGRVGTNTQHMLLSAADIEVLRRAPRV
jgi:hypothetical protein